MPTDCSQAKAPAQADFTLLPDQHIVVARKRRHNPSHNSCHDPCHVHNAASSDFARISYVYKTTQALRRAISKIMIDALRKLSKVDRGSEALERAQVVLG